MGGGGSRQFESYMGDSEEQEVLSCLKQQARTSSPGKMTGGSRASRQLNMSDDDGQ